MNIKEKQLKTHHSSFFKFFRFRNCLIPFSTVSLQYWLGNDHWDYMDIYIFGFRVARIHENK